MREIRDNFLNVDALRDSWYLLRLGVVATVVLAMTAFGLALLLGGVVAAAGSSRSRFVRKLAVLYVDVMRATPPLVSLTIVYYVAPSFGGPSLSVFQAAVLTFAMIQGAYIGEIYRGALISLEKGQIEAATSLGLSRVQTGRLVAFPQVVPVMIPPLTSQLTQVFRDTPLVFIIGYEDLLTRARQASGLTANATPLMVVAVVFLVILLSLQGLSFLVERHYRARMSRAAGLRRCFPRGLLLPLMGGTESKKGTKQP